MSFRRVLLSLLLLCVCVLPALAEETRAERAANQYAAAELAAAPPHGNLPDYSLPADKLAKAQHLETVRATLHFGGTVWSIVQLLLLLGLGGIAWMQRTAEKTGTSRALRATAVVFIYLLIWLPGLVLSLAAVKAHSVKIMIAALVLLALGTSITVRRRGLIRERAFRWVESYSFVLLFLVAGFLLDLPLALYGQHLRHVYGLSIQGWGSWLGDQGKSLLLTWLVLGAFLVLLFRIIQKFPRNWWLVGWTASAVFMLMGIFAMPYVVDPLFNQFEPLQKSQPELVARLEQVVARGHMDIPPERMFLMKASAKVTTLNAYVTGFGASKRVVVWDTSLSKGSPDQVLFIFGHESGHYVLNHVVRGITMGIGGLLVAFFLGYHFVRWAIACFGERWQVPSQESWGAFAILLLGFTLLNTVTEPITNTISRAQEHAADVYGQEAVHGLVANPQEAARSAFAVLAESSFDVPNPNLFLEFWTDGHPATGRRAAFSKAYDPWAPGMEPKYFAKSENGADK